jgi:hypothetical protein
MRPSHNRKPERFHEPTLTSLSALAVQSPAMPVATASCSGGINDV